MLRQSNRWFAALLGAVSVWCLNWLITDWFGIKSLIYDPDGARAYCVGAGALLGYSAARWGWWQTGQVYEDWRDSFGEFPLEPEAHDCGPSSGPSRDQDAGRDPQ